MYLKSIEIHGFKSFANKIVFEFQKGITAIVGPNGSGKSNVGDAVRWVLGEQSAKQLRGSKMEDIIFAGTELRKPQGFAYVAITFDNSDLKLPTSYEEVTVARRVYRSGESEYLMNGVNCRLRDVQELFLDTGIGKEGYSIIGQGQIDKILNGKPEERRELFDEAAGIVKYKKRKATAQKNLEVERQNLERINDILSELEKQVGPLKQQSETAREYLRLREDLKQLDVNLFLQEYEQLHTEEDKVENNIEIVTTDFEEKNKLFSHIKEDYERLERALEQKDIVLEKNKGTVNEKRIRKEQLEGEIKVCNEQILAAKQNDKHYQERLETILSDVDKKNKEHQKQLEEKEKLFSGMQDIEQKKDGMEEKVADCKNQMDAINDKIDQCNQEIMHRLNENATLKAKLEKYNTMLSQENVKKAQLTQRILKNKTDEAICVETLQKEEARLNEVTVQIQGKNQRLQELQEKQKADRNNLEDLRKALNIKQQDYHREQSKLETLRNMTERYDGYGQSIRRVMEQKEKNAGIVGVVADIIKVEKEYEVAMEIALGGSIQNIVTDTEETAKQLIQFLKKNRYGRATFLPLTVVGKRNVSKREDARKEPGVLGFASELVNAKKEFKNLVEYLLGRILVVDHIDHAIAVARKYNNSIRIVTLEGELLNPGGSMSGGAYKNSSNLLSRHREMEDGEKKLGNLKQDCEKVQKEIELLQSNGDLQAQERRDIQSELQQLYVLENTAKLNYKQAKSNRETIEKGYLSIQGETEDIERQFAELRGNVTMLQKQMDMLEEENEDHENKKKEYNKELEDKRKELEELREQVAGVSIEASSFEQKKEFIETNMQRIQRELDTLKEEHSRLEENAANSTQQVIEKEQAIQVMKSQLETEVKDIKEVDDYIESLKSDREETAKQHKDLLRQREQISDDLGNLDKEIFRLNNRKEKIAEQMEQQSNYMWEEYELTYQTAAEHKTETNLDFSTMKRQISEVKAKMKGLGDVNVNAIEDYRNISERYELLHSQHEDLIHSEEVLMNIVEELDIEMRKQFEEKFAEIKSQFDIVFKELFGGGKGTIELMSDEDILEAGINIIAQPPGKKLQNMMQMSGGEKALTAISLLFAIQNLKPSPFCLLDEIEAALDDSNVKRYAQYLHKLTKDTQFIVITHRRGTMSAADVMYGITMQEKGVSTMVSVNLIEDQLDEMEKAGNKN